MKYDCELIKDLLPLYHDKATSDASSKAVEEHLDECDECRRFYQEVRNTADIPFKAVSKTADTSGYLSLAKRLRRTKWYWRVGVALLVGLIVWGAVFYSGGYRFDPLQAAYTIHVIKESQTPVLELEYGSDRMLYIFEDDELYQEINVVYRFPFWHTQLMTPHRYIKQDVPIQLLTQKSIGNSMDGSLYLIYIVAVNDSNVAYLELGKEGKIQEQEVVSELTSFYWDESNTWDGSDSWSGIIVQGELEGRAYSEKGTLLYQLEYADNDYYWVEVR